jgi:signal transduction histidine kinase
MNLNSIRWRLPLSYAGIALLAALSLGLVLLSTLRNYYTRQERRYLQGNAEQISSTMAEMLEADLPASVMKDQVASWSFFLQARLKLLDQDRNVLADSGIPDTRQVLMVSNLKGTGGSVSEANVPQSSVITAIGGTSPVVPLPSWGVFLLPANETIPNDVTVFSSSSIPVTHTVNEVTLYPGASGAIETGPVTGTEKLTILTETYPLTATAGSEPVGIAMSMSPSLYGLDLNAEVSSLHHSSQSVEQAVRDRNGKLLGTIVLSDGPAYGDEIVASVTRGWLVASLVAVLLAAGVGWLASRGVTAPLLTLTNATSRMASGDLSARAEVRSPDELGTLGHSFNEMASRVEEMVNTLRYFVTDAAHELNTPLTALRTNLELATNEPDPAQQPRFLSACASQIARLNAIIEGLLSLSRLETNQRSHAPVNLNEVIQELGELYASRAEQAEIHFNIEQPPEAMVIQGNKDYFQRAVSNLVDNAFKFTPAGGTVALRLAGEGEWAWLSVTDTGIGIPEEDLPSLFQRFHRGRNAAEYPGSGLGLAIVKAIVEAYGGQVSAENTNHGSIIGFRVPINPDDHSRNKN